MSSHFSEVNPHALAAIAASTEQHEVVAAQDIVCAESGMKLWAKGKTITPQLQENLLKRKLAQPLETSLTVKNGVSGSQIVDIAQRQLENHEALGKLAGRKAGVIISLLMDLELQPPIKLLMTAAQDRRDGSFEHAVAVCLTTTALALRAGWPNSVVENIVLAGLIHDVGELYVNPDYLQVKRQLTPEEWMHVVVHPKVGAMLLQEMTTYPPEVADMVFSHHERMDGTGYPRQLTGVNLGREAQVLSIAETVTGILVKRDNSICRAAFALKVILREYDPTLVGLLTSLANASACQLPMDFQLEAAIHSVQYQAQSLEKIVQTALTLSRTPLEPKLRQLAERCLALTSKLYASLIATGALEYCDYQQNIENDEAEILLSLEIIPSEIRWRIRSLARDIELAIRSCSPQQREPFAPLEQLLAQATTTPASAPFSAAEPQPVLD
jgi:HD-GYP domain-containing protein (c-di-GMP phosphodiesterase class II)